MDENIYYEKKLTRLNILRLYVIEHFICAGVHKLSTNGILRGSF